MELEDKIKILIKDYRIILVFMVILLSIIFIRPSLSISEKGTFTLHTNIKKGIDLEGGVTAIIKPDIPTYENAQKIMQILLNRISTFGLKESKSSLVEINGEYYIDLSLAGATEEDLKQLIEKQGVFKAYIERKAKKSSNNTYSFRLKRKIFTLNNGENNTIIYKNQTIHVNETFKVEDFNIRYINKTQDEVTLWIEAFSGEDIKSVLTGASYSSIVRAEGGYRYGFTVTISQKAAENMKILTDDMVPIGEHLNEQIVFVLDDNIVDKLYIDADLKGVATTNPQITGGGKTKEEAIENMRRLTAILQSGSFPVGVKIVEIQEISPTLGGDFLKISIYAIVFALIFVSLVIFIVYKDPRIVIPMILTSITEVTAILGFAALVSWTIDLAAIAGIVAAIGTGIDDQIVVIDEAKKKREKESLRLKLKRAFFIIFSSAATTIGAMTPLLMSSFANVKGFAFTTIVGVLIGVFITRPAFARTVKVLLNE